MPRNEKSEHVTMTHPTGTRRMMTHVFSHYRRYSTVIIIIRYKIAPQAPARGIGQFSLGPDRLCHWQPPKMLCTDARRKAQNAGIMPIMLLGKYPYKNAFSWQTASIFSSFSLSTRPRKKIFAFGALVFLSFDPAYSDFLPKMPAYAHAAEPPKMPFSMPA